MKIAEKQLDGDKIFDISTKNNELVLFFMNFKIAEIILKKSKE
jgi:hypothetical protein